MPIRTPRGRSAAYRALWQWPLRSPARLGLTAIFLLALVVGAVAGINAATTCTERGRRGRRRRGDAHAPGRAARDGRDPHRAAAGRPAHPEQPAAVRRA